MSVGKLPRRIAKAIMKSHRFPSPKNSLPIRLRPVSIQLALSENMHPSYIIQFTVIVVPTIFMHRLDRPCISGIYQFLESAPN